MELSIDRYDNDITDSCEPPPYDPEAEIEDIPQEQTSGARVFEISLDEDYAESGSFLTGKLTIVPPRHMGNIEVILEATCTEKALDAKKRTRKELAKRTNTLAMSRIPVPLDLTKGKRYTVPFSLKLPCSEEENSVLSQDGQFELDAFETKSHHFDLPPSLDVMDDTTEIPASISYAVEGKINHFVFKAKSPFKFQPKLAQLSLDSCFNAQGVNLEHEYKASTEVFKQMHHRSTSAGILVASGFPIYHSPRLSREGNFAICLGLLLHNGKYGKSLKENFNINEITCSIYRQVWSARDGINSVLDKTSHNVLHESKLSARNLINKYSWDGPRTDILSNLRVWYTIPDAPVFEIPSFLSYLTAVTYEMELNIKHTLGKTTLRLPFVLRREYLPSYNSTMTATETPIMNKRS